MDQLTYTLETYQQIYLYVHIKIYTHTQRPRARESEIERESCTSAYNFYRIIHMYVCSV